MQYLLPACYNNIIILLCIIKIHCIERNNFKSSGKSLASSLIMQITYIKKIKKKMMPVHTLSYPRISGKP